jgi:hypothetical protein
MVESAGERTISNPGTAPLTDSTNAAAEAHREVLMYLMPGRVR